MYSIDMAGLRADGLRSNRQRGGKAASARRAPQSATARGDQKETFKASPALSAPSRIHVDVTDLFNYLRDHLNVSGIQRVQVAFIWEACRRRGAPEFGDIDFVVVRWGTGEIISIDIDDLMLVVDIVSRNDKTRVQLDEALEACRSSTTAPVFASRDVYFIPGAFWVCPSYSQLLIELKERGVFIGIFIHDLIPITHRYFVVDEVADDFTRRLNEILPLCDIALSNSRYVAGQLRSYIERVGGREIPIEVVRLAHEMGGMSCQEALSPLVERLGRSRFVLCVGTIEARKNHQYLIKAWRQLLEEGEFEVPTLVLVGRWGWYVQDLREELFEANFLQGRVVVLNSISDVDLSHLYRNCEFSVYASFVEGWGLPIGESLAHGSPCVASNTASMPEVGGDLVRYFNPYDLDSGLPVFRQLLSDPSQLALLRKRIQSEFKLVSWREVAEHAFSTLRELSHSGEHDTRTAFFAPVAGWVFPLGGEYRGHLRREDARLPEVSLLRVRGWHSLEHWGCWSSSPEAVLRFHSGRPAGTPLVIGIKVKLPNTVLDARVEFAGPKQEAEVKYIGHKASWQFLSVDADETGAGELVVSVFVHEDVVSPLNDKRGLFAGLEAFCFAPADDMETRLEMLQNIATYESLRLPS